MSRALATIALGVALVLAAAVFDSPSLYPAGIALSVLVVGMIAWVRLAARGARVSRAAGPSTVVEEEPYPLRIRVRAGLLPLPGGELVEPLLGWPVPIAGRWSRRIRINVRFSRRGRRILEPGRLVIRDPLHLHECTVAGEEGGELLVLPRVEPVLVGGRGGGGSSSQRALAGGNQGPAGRRLDGSTAELELDGLRPYRTGSPASRIHWPAVARTREMLERRLVADANSAPLVVLDPTRPASQEALDRAVRAAASLCVHLARAGGCAVLLPGERRPVELGHDMGAWPQLHARLALVEADAGVPALGPAPRDGAMFWVWAGAGERLPRTLERLSAAARFLVTPLPRAGYRTVFTVAGCSGQRLERSRRAGGIARRSAA